MRKHTLMIAAMTLVGIAAWALWQGASAPAQEGEADNYETRLWNWLKKVRYQEWAPAPGKDGDFYPGQSPHGAFLKMYLNRPAVSNPSDPPPGSMVIKENYNDAKELAAVTIMYRVEGYDSEHDDWYWVKYLPNGEVDTKGDARLAGKLQGCIDCHSSAVGDDYLFFNDEGAQ